MHTHPKVAAVASQNWPFRHDAKCEPLLKFLKANIHEASSHAYPLNLPTRVREDPKFFGLPNVEPMQAAVMQQLEERMLADIDRFSPEALMTSWLPMGPRGAEQIQDFFRGVFSRALKRA